MSDVSRDPLLPTGRGWTPYAVFLFCAFWVSLALWTHQPTRAKGVETPAAAFSAYRAHAHLEQFATRPHPYGSPENAAVRDYLVDTIRGMGYEPEVHQHLLPQQVKRPRFVLARVDNVMVRVRGTGNGAGKALMLMAHYDSVVFGPGASDDGSGVVVMLESLRAMKEHPPLQNDIVFLFTDGEEAGLLGPKAFMAHPWYGDVGMVINFEARGHYGPGYMYETSPENGWLIRQLKAAAPKPIANSLMFDIAGRMPTTTDYEVLKKQGMPGMNFAFVGGIKYYHTPNDSPEMISKDTIQHQGDNALAMILQLGNQDLSNVNAPDASYFNTLGGHLIVYPMTWVMPFAIGVLLVYLAMVFVGRKRGYLNLGGVLLGALCVLSAMVVVAALVGVLTLLAWLRFDAYMIYNSDLFFAGFAALSVTIVALLYTQFRRKVSIWSLAAGAQLWWLVGMGYLAVVFPGTAYALTWPLGSSALAMLLVFLLGPASSDRLRLGILLAGALVPLVLVGPWVYLVSVAVTIIPVAAWMGLAVLTMGLLLPLMAVMAQPNPRWLPALGSIAATPLLLLAFFWFQFTPQYPKMNHLCYGMDCSTGQAWWMSDEEVLDSWMRNIFPDDTRGSVEAFRPGMAKPFRLAPAPLATFAQPAIDVLSDTVEGDRRVLLLLVRSPRQAGEIMVRGEAGAPVYAAALEGVPLGTDDGNPQNGGEEHWAATFRGLSEAGVELRLKVPLGPLKLTALEQSFGVLPVNGVTMPELPANMISRNNVMKFWEPFKSDAVFSLKHFEI